MDKIITDVYTYRDVRILLSDDYWSRVEKNPSYSLRAYSSQVSISPTYLSQYLSNKIEITEKQLSKTLKSIGFNSEEIDYCIKLNTYKRNQNKGLKDQILEDEIKEKYIYPDSINKTEDSAILKSPLHFIVHSMIPANQYESKESIYSKFQIIKDSRSLFDEIISDLNLKKDIILNEAGEVKGVGNIVIDNCSLSTMKNNKALSSFIHDTIILNKEYDDKNISNALSLSIPKDKIKTAREITTKALHDLMRLHSEHSSSKNIMFYTQEYTVFTK